MIDVIKTEAIRKNDVHLLDRTFTEVIFNELEDKMKELAINQLVFSNFSKSSLEMMFLEVYAEYCRKKYCYWVRNLKIYKNKYFYIIKSKFAIGVGSYNQHQNA